MSLVTDSGLGLQQFQMLEQIFRAYAVVLPAFGLFSHGRRYDSWPYVVAGFVLLYSLLVFDALYWRITAVVLVSCFAFFFDEIMDFIVSRLPNGPAWRPEPLRFDPWVESYPIPLTTLLDRRRNRELDALAAQNPTPAEVLDDSDSSTWPSAVPEVATPYPPTPLLSLEEMWEEQQTAKSHDPWEDPCPIPLTHYLDLRRARQDASPTEQEPSGTP